MAVLAIGGCAVGAPSSSQVTPPPGSPAPSVTEPVSSYAGPRAEPFTLYTHCGADWRTSFEGSYWDLASPVTAPIGGPYQAGTMRLLDQQTARFDYQVDGHPFAIVFHRHDPGVPLKPPIGCD